jgi:hypothetical protein
MKIKFKNILSALLVAATAKVAANPTVDSLANFKLPDNNGNNEKELSKGKDNLLQKYIIKFKQDGDYLIAGHRSHRSHSSHRSHRSSSSGSYYTPPRSSSSSSSSNSSPSNSSSTSRSNSSSGTSSQSNNSTTARPLKSTEKAQNDTTKTTKVSAARICNLGDRTISLGACGTDVKVLATLLGKHGYLTESAIETNADGYTICNAAMVTAIKKFQKDAGLKADGYAGTATIKALKNWKKTNEK